MSIMGKSVLITGDAIDSEYNDDISAESIRNARKAQPLSLTEAVQVVEGLRGTKGISRSQILVTLRNMGASENTINLAIKRNAHVNSSKRSNL